jgi:hypothetical protein
MALVALQGGFTVLEFGDDFPHASALYKRQQRPSGRKKSGFADISADIGTEGKSFAKHYSASNSDHVILKTGQFRR